MNKLIFRLPTLPDTVLCWTTHTEIGIRTDLGDYRLSHCLEPGLSVGKSATYNWLRSFSKDLNCPRRNTVTLFSKLALLFKDNSDRSGNINVIKLTVTVHFYNRIGHTVDRLPIPSAVNAIVPVWIIYHQNWAICITVKVNLLVMNRHLNIIVVLLWSADGFIGHIMRHQCCTVDAFRKCRQQRTGPVQVQLVDTRFVIAHCQRVVTGSGEGGWKNMSMRKDVAFRWNGSLSAVARTVSGRLPRKLSEFFFRNKR